ncbi:hypothetical protein BBK36DRAFT_1196051 [Trichoderma citrinoviride]|uniref:SUZ domain-containing protein n=1 Tax=Trichoderma citrinoviride TaxID=58853 RepID=A0A2T4BD56_9HYPO|nr:hypothetical protein BBK36DRAFT_1196051 [Trichoderma citrinoviride]PTB67273.1 hypothetical protein BBK36DRAFT_1196051 [Trichoderma citrinoviride]
MSKASGIPNAWDDDDWEAQADRERTERKNAKEPQQVAPQQTSMSRQERLQQHAEANRKLWESADSPETLYHVEASGGVPLTASFKPQVKVLSRKPVVAKRNPGAGGGASLSGGGDGDDDDLRPEQAQMTPEEIRAKQKRDREEKQRRYDEARAKIFGESAPSSRGSSPGTGGGAGGGAVTPPRTEGRGAYRGRGRGRGGNFGGGGGGGYHGGINNNSSNYNSSYNNNNNNVSNTEISGQEFEPRRTTNQSGPRRELFDPNSSQKPDSGRRGGRDGSGSDSSHSSAQRT